MGSRHQPARRRDTQTFETKDDFVEACIAALQSLDLVQLVRNPPAITDFMHAYVIARCLPVVMVRRPRSGDTFEEEHFDDEIFKVTIMGEGFLRGWKPTTIMEAALMLDAYTWDHEPNESLDAVPEAVETFLLETFFEQPFAFATSDMLSDFAHRLGHEPGRLSGASRCHRG